MVQPPDHSAAVHDPEARQRQVVVPYDEERIQLQTSEGALWWIEAWQGGRLQAAGGGRAPMVGDNSQRRH